MLSAHQLFAFGQMFAKFCHNLRRTNGELIYFESCVLYFRTVYSIARWAGPAGAARLGATGTPGPGHGERPARAERSWTLVEACYAGFFGHHTHWHFWRRFFSPPTRQRGLHVTTTLLLSHSQDRTLLQSFAYGMFLPSPCNFVGGPCVAGPFCYKEGVGRCFFELL